MIKTFKSTFLLFAVVGFSWTSMTSCSDDNDVVIPKLNDSGAKTELASITVPPNKKVFFDFKTNSVQDSSKSMVNLSGMYGSNLKNSRDDVYSMGYFDMENTSVEKLTLKDILAVKITATNEFTIDASSAGAPAKGATWIIYDFKNNHAVYPTPNRYIVMYKGKVLSDEAEELYVINAGKITAAQGTAAYNINVKKFIK